jgi:membrane protein implicated in regulation of membrane protease activity
MIWNWIVDHIPVWVYIVAGGLGIGAAFYFFSPILVPLWNLTPRWVKVVGAFIVSIFLAAVAGRYRGRHDAEEEERRKNAEALRKRQEVENETNKMSSGEVDKKLRDRWSRTDDS